MTRKWVINASPFIVLAKVDHAYLFAELSDQFVMPQAVALEISQAPLADKARQLLKNKTWPIVNTPQPTPELLRWDLGAGETAVLAYAMVNQDWTAVLDDRAARRFATTAGISVKGTVGLVILAKQRGLIESASQLLRQLIKHEFRISERLLREVLPQAVGEEWDN